MTFVQRVALNKGSGEVPEIKAARKQSTGLLKSRRNNFKL
jgi:hypothetical protein